MSWLKQCPSSSQLPAFLNRRKSIFSLYTKNNNTPVKQKKYYNINRSLSWMKLKPQLCQVLIYISSWSTKGFSILFTLSPLSKGKVQVKESRIPLTVLLCSHLHQSDVRNLFLQYKMTYGKHNIRMMDSKLKSQDPASNKHWKQSIVLILDWVNV